MPAADPVAVLKEQLARSVVERLDGWTQANAAELLRTDQPRMSDLRRGRLTRFSLEHLIRLAWRVGGDVRLELTWVTRDPWSSRRGFRSR
jgi:predicted XRE-type DNA-binding protein